MGKEMEKEENIEYNEEGYLIFEGEYLNDLKWNGYVYDPFNNII